MSDPLLHLLQIAKERASVYALDEDTKQWRERGTTGKIVMFQHDTEAEDVRIKWEPSSSNHDASAAENWWRLTSSKLKPKGERALVLKAWCMSENQQEILAIRFASQRAAIEFAKKYHLIFPYAVGSNVDIENIFENQKQNASVKGASMSEAARFVAHGKKTSQPPPPPRRADKPAPPKPPRPLHAPASAPMKHGGGGNNPMAAMANALQQRMSVDMSRDLPDELANEFEDDDDNDNGDEDVEQQQALAPKRAAVKADPNMKPLSWRRPDTNEPEHEHEHEHEHGGADVDEHWKCSICTYQNARNALKCQMCGCDQGDEPEGVEKWECPACTFSNHPHSNRCEVCQAVRPGANASDDDEEAANGAGGGGGGGGEPYNQIPEKKKANGDGGGAAGGGHYGQWQCARCTLYNNNDTKVCAVCGGPKDASAAADDDDDNRSSKPKPKAVPNMYDDEKHEYRQGIYTETPFQRMMNMSMNHDQAPQQQQQQQQQPLQQHAQAQASPQLAPKNGVHLQRIRKNVSEVTEQDLTSAASDIACYNATPSAVFSTLRSVAKKLLRGDSRYRTLDTTNPKVMERLIGFEGVLGFLQLLGFESDAIGAKLICQRPPPPQMVNVAIEILNRYQYRFRITDNGYGHDFNKRYSAKLAMAQQQEQPYQAAMNHPFAAPNMYGGGGGGGNALFQGMNGAAYGNGNGHMNGNMNGNMNGWNGAMNNGFGYGHNMQHPQQMMPQAYHHPHQHPPAPHQQQMMPHASSALSVDPFSPEEDDEDEDEPLGGGGITDGWDEPDALSGSGNENKKDVLTLEQLILWATNEYVQDNDTMETLIMTHKIFTDSLTLLRAFRRRFSVPIPKDVQSVDEFQQNVQKPIQLKVMKALRDWMKGYWFEDFHDCEEVQNELLDWLKQLAVYQYEQATQSCVWVHKLHDLINKEYDRLKKIDWDGMLQRKLNLLAEYDDVELNATRIAAILGNARAEDLADQITLLDYQLFSRIEPRECVHQRWKDEKFIRDAPNVLLLIQQFNNFSIFIQVQILREGTLQKRVKVLRRIIKMGAHFLASQNYNSLCALFSALNAAPIHRLKVAWSRVPSTYREQFNSWLSIFKRDFNHRALRTLLRKAGGSPCIPHIGVFLQDLVFIDEGNKKKVVYEALNGNEMLNFNKCVRIADRIKNLRLFQNERYSTKIKENRVVQKVLLAEFDKLKDVTEDQLWDMSTVVRDQDIKQANAPFHKLGGGAAKENAIPAPNPVSDEPVNVDKNNPLL